MRRRSSAVTSTSAGDSRKTLVATLSNEPRSANAESGGEVDESFGVGVVHGHQVHDDRGAVAEPLADGAGLAVVLRAQRGDLGQRAARLEELGHTARIHRQRPAGRPSQRAEPRRCPLELTRCPRPRLEAVVVAVATAVPGRCVVVLAVLVAARCPGPYPSSSNRSSRGRREYREVVPRSSSS